MKVDKVYRSKNPTYKGEFSTKTIQGELESRIERYSKFRKEIGACVHGGMSRHKKSSAIAALQILNILWEQRILPKIQNIREIRSEDVRLLQPKFSLYTGKMWQQDSYLQKQFESNARECFAIELAELDSLIGCILSELGTGLRKAGLLV